MKKKSILLGWALIALLSPAARAQELPGCYVGDFVGKTMDSKKHPMVINKINISIDSVAKDQVKGHSVVAGNNRPFQGTIVKQKEQYLVHVKEPGDNQYDGVFKFTLDPARKTATGNWVANDKKLAVSERRFQLKKMTFKYDPDLKLEKWLFDTRGGSRQVWDTYDPKRGKSEALTADAGKLNASTTLLKSRDVENMYKRDLEVMRNAIYARHGYSFQNRDMRHFFDQVPWYIPMSVDVTNELTEVERKNIEILKRYENHATSYYDRFGR